MTACTAYGDARAWPSLAIMMRRLLGALMLLAGTALAAPSAIQWAACGTGIDSHARCGKLTVPLDYNRPDQGTLQLNLAVLKSEASTPPPDPVFFFVGGPGQAATDLAYGAGPWLTSLRRTRDIVLVDQRGTGGSGGLFCRPDGPRSLPTLLGELFPAEEMKRCYAAHHVRSELFTTEVAMRDMDVVRQALGFDRINLFGASYGTRAALSYLRQFPQHVRTVILKSPAPMNLVLVQHFAPDSQASFNRLMALCSAAAECGKKFSALPKEVKALGARLRAQPVITKMENDKTHQEETVTVDSGLFATTIRSALYSRRSASRLPVVLHSAYAGDWRPFLREAIRIRRGIDEDAAGLYTAIVCAEDYPFLDRKTAVLAARNTFLDTYWLDQIRQGCASWPAHPVARRYRQDVRSAIPVLLLTGALDPVTPPKYSITAARYLSNSVVVTYPYGSHGFNEGDCEVSLISTVVSTGKVKNLDVSCASLQKPPQFALEP